MGRTGRRAGSVLVLLALCAIGLAPAGTAAASDPGSGGAGGPLYVSDYGNDRVLRVARRGGQDVVPAVGLVRPTGMVVDAAGDLYVADTGNNRVVRIPAGGGPQVTVATDGLSRPSGWHWTPRATCTSPTASTTGSSRYPRTAAVSAPYPPRDSSTPGASPSTPRVPSTSPTS